MRGSQSHPTRETKALLPPVGWDRMGAGVGGEESRILTTGPGVPLGPCKPWMEKGAAEPQSGPHLGLSPPSGGLCLGSSFAGHPPHTQA